MYLSRFAIEITGRLFALVKHKNKTITVHNSAEKRKNSLRTNQIFVSFARQ
ncbi:hypothetical protein BJQ96_01498 [Flavobacterium sp. PL0002]|nr:hypothetical protein [Flavobacterium sp. PL002]